MAARLVPTAQQLEWQKMEFTAFLHFGMNTFTGNEWGDGKDSPALFNPTDLDCDQWVKALKEGGFKMAIITAKHHDGFCLWPTQTTNYSVAASPWKQGKGDVVAELRKACEKYGLKFGVYLSPWDRNASCYGDSPAYNRFFIKQLTELLTNYGEVHEVWFDGANGEGPNGKKQVYDWVAILKTIRELQPAAVTAIMGNDVRWVGNEGGLGRETEWSATVYRPESYAPDKSLATLDITAMSKDLGSRDMVAKADALYWYPSEVDVSIRPGWFYHAEQDSQVRSVGNLVNIYFQSVGRNSVLLLNIPPDRRGHIHETDVERIKGLRQYIDETFAHNLVAKGDEYWKAETGQTRTYRVDNKKAFNTLLLQEDIARGQRVEAIKVEALVGKEWKELATCTTVGYKRLLRFPEVTAKQIRVTVTAARGQANICQVGAYYAQPLAESGIQYRMNDADPASWKAVGMDAEARKAFDGKAETTWRTASLCPVTIDMGQTETMKGFIYTPTADKDLKGTVFTYNFAVSNDGQTWTPCVTKGEFSNIMHNPVPYNVRFDKEVKARYIRLEPLREINAEAATAVSEIGILK